MSKITYIEHSGKSHTIEVPKELSVMEGALQNNIPGIDADCGGCCSCATCHVYVDEAWLEGVGPIGPTEETMLSLSSDRKENSRLSCQITVSEELDGLVVKTPEFQF